jgi:hypothetical protein
MDFKQSVNIAFNIYKLLVRVETVLILVMLFLSNGACNNQNEDSIFKNENESYPKKEFYKENGYYKDFYFDKRQGVGKLTQKDFEKLYKIHRPLVKLIFMNEEIDSIYVYDLFVASPLIKIKCHFKDPISVYEVIINTELYGDMKNYMVVNNSDSTMVLYDFSTPIIRPDNSFDCLIFSQHADSSRLVDCSIRQKDTINFMEKIFAKQNISIKKIYKQGHTKNKKYTPSLISFLSP